MCFGKDKVCIHQALLCDGFGDCLFEDDEMECGERDSRTVNQINVIDINGIRCIITYGEKITHFLSFLYILEFAFYQQYLRYSWIFILVCLSHY